MIIGVMVAMHDSKCIYVVASPACATSTWCKAHRNKAMCITSGKIKYVLVNVQAARRYRIYSEAVDYTGRGRSPRRGIVNSRGGYPVRAETPDVN